MGRRIRYEGSARVLEELPGIRREAEPGCSGPSLNWVDPLVETEGAKHVVSVRREECVRL